MEKESTYILIDFKALFIVLWAEKLVVLIIILCFTFSGIYYAFSLREEFISQGKILPEMSVGGSSFGGLANLVGIGGFGLGNNNNSDAIRPDLYPDILESTQYYLKLLNQTIITKHNESISFEQYYHMNIEYGVEPKTNSLKKYAGQPNGVIVVNKLTETRIKDLKKRLVNTIDKNSGVIIISAKMPDPVVAASVTKFSMDYLTNYITEYKTEKAKQDVDFLKNKVANVQTEFFSIQAKRAKYADSFSATSMRIQSADVERERINSEYQLTLSLYNELMKKYEEAKLKLQQETPVFQILEPPVVPNLKSEPKKSIILFIFIFIGIIVSIIFSLILRKNYRLVLKKEEQ